MTNWRLRYLFPNESIKIKTPQIINIFKIDQHTFHKNTVNVFTMQKKNLWHVIKFRHYTIVRKVGNKKKIIEKILRWPLYFTKWFAFQLCNILWYFEHDKCATYVLWSLYNSRTIKQCARHRCKRKKKNVCHMFYGLKGCMC